MSKKPKPEIEDGKELTEAQKEQKVENMTEEAEKKEYLGEGQPGVLPADEDNEALNKAEAAGQAGETNIVGASNPANEIAPPRKEEPTIPTLEEGDGDTSTVGIKHVWDMNFANAKSNVEGLGHAFAAIGIDFTAAPETDDEDRSFYHFVLSDAVSDGEDNGGKEIEKGKLIRNATVDDVYGVFLDFCLKYQPVYLGNFGANASKKD